MMTYLKSSESVPTRSLDLDIDADIPNLKL